MLQRIDWFRLFKYSIYSLLTLNVALFFLDEWAAAMHTFGAGPPLPQIIEAFAASIDTAAWVVLLLLFELETWQIPDHALTPRVSTALRSLRALCYLFIVSAFYGYLTKALGFANYAIHTGQDPCRLVADGFALVTGLDEYEPLTSDVCRAMGGGEHYVNRAIKTVADAATLTGVVRLAWVDVINSAAWILVVLNLEMDVSLSVKPLLRDRLETWSKCAKYALYAVLLAVAIYWGIFGTFLDFWDAFLWIAAFVFIERNVFEWERESAESGGWKD